MTAVQRTGIALAACLIFPPLLGRFLFPMLNFPYHLSGSGGLGNAAVTLVNPLTGTARGIILAAFFALSFFGVDWTAPWTARRFSIGAWIFFAALTWLYLPASSGSDFLFAALAMTMGAWLIRPKNLGEVSFPLAIAFAGLSAAFCALGWEHRVTFPASHTLWGIAGSTGGLAAAYFFKLAEPGSARRRRLAELAVVASLLTFSQWPVVTWPGAAVLLFFPLWSAYRAHFRLDFDYAEGLIWRVALPMAVIGICGTPALWLHGIDVHHEAEFSLPPWLLFNGKIPLRDFSLMHGLGIDVLPGLVAKVLYGFSLAAIRMVGGFVVAPLRALLVSAILFRSLARREALLVWGLAFWFGAFTDFATNDLFRLEPVLLAILGYVHYAFTGDRRSLAWTAGLVPWVFLLVPETGIGFGAGFFAAGAFALGSSDRRGEDWRYAAKFLLLSGLGMAMVLLGTGMAFPFLHSLAHVGAMSQHLIARWTDQSPLAPAMLTHLFVLGFSSFVILREGFRSASVQPILPLFTMSLLLTYSTFSDDLSRLPRTFLIDLLTLLLAVSALPKAARAIRIPALLFVLVGMAPLPQAIRHYFTAREPHAPTVASGLPRLGEFAGTDLSRLKSLAIWNAQNHSYANLSGSELDALFLKGGNERHFIPLHVAFQPEAQTRVLNDLRTQAPEFLLYRTDWDAGFWQVAPYSLIHHTLEAYVLGHYRFDAVVGGYVVLKAGQVTEQTHADLLPETLDRPLEYGWAPFLLGEEAGRGIRGVMKAYPRQSWWWWQIELETSAGEAELVIRPRNTTAKPVHLRFKTRNDQRSHVYSVPLWNLIHWTGKSPVDHFDFELATSAPESNRITNGGILNETLGLPTLTAQKSP